MSCCFFFYGTSRDDKNIFHRTRVSFTERATSAQFNIYNICWGLTSQFYYRDNKCSKSVLGRVSLTVKKEEREKWDTKLRRTHIKRWLTIKTYSSNQACVLVLWKKKRNKSDSQGKMKNEDHKTILIAHAINRIKNHFLFLRGQPTRFFANPLLVSMTQYFGSVCAPLLRL